LTYSLDEMTGIQALERTMPNLDMKPGRCEKVEFEYIRHGTQSLLASLNVTTGQIDQASVGDTRTEVDLDAHLWFSILVRKLLRRPSFTSQADQRFALIRHELQRDHQHVKHAAGQALS
jgi:hypothetical protein